VHRIPITTTGAQQTPSGIRRAGWNQTTYSYGNDPNEMGAYGFHEGNSDKQTHDVASLKPNPNGLYDMHGNVWETIQDWYDEVLPPHAVDPQGPLTGGTSRVKRGGST